MKEDFLRLYAGLNLEQKEAVDSIEGPVMVIAGPGTGKTHLLSMRIANILFKTDTAPESVLALTFTESGVVSMRRKLSKIMGSAAFRVEISTFHGFSNDIIKDYPEDFPEIIGGSNISDVEQIELLKKIINEEPLKALKPFGDSYFYLHSIISSIGELKREGLDPEAFKEKVQEKEREFFSIPDLYYQSGRYEGKMKGKYEQSSKQIERNKELVLVYQKYQKELEAQKLYDYGDMIMKVAKVLENNKNLLLALQERYQYILVDEHQDTNGAQNRILELLSNYYDKPNLFIVGDERQSIYRFQGASAENFHYFQMLFSPKIIYLKSNYRSSQTILDAAGTGLCAKMGREEAPISFKIFRDLDEELYYLAKDVLKHPEEEIAVLYRENKEAMDISRIFEKMGIPFTIESDQNVMDDEDIKKLLIIFKCIQNFGSPEDLIQMLHLDFLNISALDIYGIARNPYELGKSSDAIYCILTKLSKWKKESFNENPLNAFENVIRDSGFLNHILSKPLAVEKIKKVHSLFNRLKNLAASHKDYSLNNFFSYIDILREENIFVRSESVPGEGNVRLMTAHKSKGLEFDYVYIINAIHGQWGAKRNRKYIKLPETRSQAEDDDRNLFYVAMTRARKKLHISYSTHNREGREQLPSKFLQEIDGKYLQIEENHQDYDRAVEFVPAVITSSLKEKKVLNELFFKYGLSATALNNYLECPWKYFYRNLIRVPEASNKHVMFGSAVHNAFKMFFDRLIKGEKVQENNLIEAFVSSLNFQPFSKNEYLQALEKGKRALSGYYRNYCFDWKRNALSEYGVQRIELADNIFINGKIDKIEIKDLDNHVNVVDYKTGKRKNTENYHRQLIFYKLLLDNYENSKFNATSGEIDFVEPDERGKYRKEKFDLGKEEAEDLKEQIISVSNEIINLKFWGKTCRDPACPYCSMRKLMS